MEYNLKVNMNEYLPLRDVVFNTLRDAILKGELEPGERLMEIQLAERLGVSRPSVTKALANLSSQSLVEVVDRDVRLARRGLEIAQTTFEKHEFFRRLLCDAGVDGGTASKEVCRLEHCISDPSFRRLTDHLVSLRGRTKTSE